MRATVVHPYEPSASATVPAPNRRRPAVGPPRWVNRLVIRILRSSLHPLLGRALALVTVTGRRTGKPITVPVMYARRGEDLVVLVAHAARKRWWRNLEGSADVGVTLHGRRLGMRATVLTQDPERAEALRVYLERFPKAHGQVAATDVVVRFSPTTVHRLPATGAKRPAARSARRLAAGLIALAFGLACVSLLGPLTGGPVEYHVGETLRNQTIGLDAVSLFVIAPLALLAATLIMRGRIAGRLLTLGIGAYTAYMFVQYVVGPEYLSRPGDNQLLFPLYLALFSLGWILALAAWLSVDVEKLPATPRRNRLLGRVVLPVFAFLAFSRYLPALADAMSVHPADPGYAAGPTFFWAIALLDLGVFLPATAATCVGLARRTAWASKALYLVVGWFGLVGPAVAAMAIAMTVNHDPNATMAGAVSMTVLGLAFAALAVALYRPLLRPRPE